MIKVFVVDDQAMVRESFAAVLGAQPDITVVGTAGDGVAALAGIPAAAPDVVLMDIRMPEMDGLEATWRLLSGPTSLRVVVLTTSTRRAWSDRAWSENKHARLYGDGHVGSAGTA